MTFRDIEREILQDGWKHHKTKGSHYFYKHLTKPGKVCIPYHANKDLPPKTISSIRKQAGLK
ncbi:MAG: type II toxin-antitoxin system HicA family toxin [Defluviitaleaceae bacterium]|nr:type II toxin-antitoxin system HicA family toxin [Defluviitaleaceae bacterium]